jgi:hypothetical protein
MRRTSAHLSLVAAATVFYAAFIVRTRFTAGEISGFTLFDDAMISMRYARNLAEGHGLVFNAGGTAVEGYSNPLWTFWMVAIHVAGAPDLYTPLAVAVTGALLLLVLAWMIYRVACSLFSDAPAVAAGAMFLVSFNYALVFWTLRGMEVGLLALLFLVAIWGAIRFEATRDSRALVVVALALAASILTRRDAVIAAPVLAGYFAWVLGGRTRVVAIWITIAAAFAALAVQTAFSLWYYGDPLPNTYYLKMTGTPVSERMARGASTAVLALFRNVGPLLVPALVPLFTGTRAQRRAALLMLSMLGACMTYSVYVGGDAWEYNGHANRYVAPALPGLCLLAAVGLHRAVETGFGRTMAACVLVVASARVLIELASMRWGWIPTRGYEVYLAAPTLSAGLAVSVSAILFLCAARLMLKSADAGHRAPLTGIAALVAIVWVTANGHPFVAWAVKNADHLHLDTRWAARGIELRAVASADAVTAVTAAGNLPYFSRLQTIDLHGKMDRVIARSGPVGEFRPGHDKWDLVHSLATRPDIISDFRPSPSESAYLEALGYIPFGEDLFVLRGTPRVHAELMHLGRSQLQPAQ